MNDKISTQDSTSHTDIRDDENHPHRPLRLFRTGFMLGAAFEMYSSMITKARQRNRIDALRSGRSIVATCAVYRNGTKRNRIYYIYFL